MARCIEILIGLVFLVFVEDPTVVGRPIPPLLTHAKIKDFLEKYSGLPAGSSDSEEWKNAVENVQRFYQLEVTGVLDVNTVKAMTRPRCEVSDVAPGSAAKRHRSRRYELIGNGPVANWQDADGIGWYYVHDAAKVDLNETTVKDSIQKAAQMWMDACPGLSNVIREVTDISSGLKTEDFLIYFGTKKHRNDLRSDACPYTFGSNVLAHVVTGGQHISDIHINSAYNWAVQPGDGVVGLIWVVVHEMGHSLGLGHTDVEGSVMLPYYPSNATPITAVGPDDAAGAIHMYGNTTATTAEPPSTTDPTPPPSTTPSTTPDPASCPHYPCNGNQGCINKCEKWCSNIISDCST